ncbi:hypothetical protein [Deefgea rivuli]|uniref:hypothetical protein n=1 Tax=Deefgea rivuli TaxID=400948 RepID=UPI0005690951|nr:hypothetical protein [Deefgea rivuli]
MSHLKSAEEARKMLQAHGLRISSWADANGFQRAHVYALLEGRARGTSGEAHKIAIALGMKAEPIGPSPLPTTAEATST